MTTKQKQLDEKIQTGGGATGVAHTADPEGARATLPKSNLNNGEQMPNKIANITPGQGGVDGEDTDTENNVKVTGDTSAQNKSSVSMKEDMEALFNGEDLSEDFKVKVSTIFEAAVNTKISMIEEELKAQYETSLSEQVELVKEEMTSKMDEYMNYVVTQWMEENKVAIESSLKNEITESFIDDLKSLFEKHNIYIPEEKVDVLEQVQADYESLEGRLNEVLEENIALTGMLEELVREKMIDSISEGLTENQAEKFKTLAENVEFDSPENYEKKLQIVKENYFTNETAPKKQDLNEEIEHEAQPASVKHVNSTVAQYASAISRTVKK